MINTQETRWITADQGARMLGVTVRTFYRYIRNGDVPATKLVGKWMVPEEVLRDLLMARALSNVQGGDE